MSLALIYSRAVLGVSAPLIEVEAHLSNGLPAFNMVGLPETEVKESRDRVRAAIIQSGFDFPAKKITINLAPADLPKHSGRFDLPIALGILAASKQIDTSRLSEYEFIGELALSGRLRPIRGVIAMARACQEQNRALILPMESAIQAALVPNSTTYGAPDLLAVCAHLNQTQPLTFISSDEAESMIEPIVSTLDFSEVKGQQTAKQALILAACGAHSVLLMGPPGTGKSMLAARLPSILPDLSMDERLDVSALYGLSPQSNIDVFGKTRPFRSPHHSASAVALVGGGSMPKPGEISLAHNGILFLDELPEFDRKVLEVLREPLESGEIHVSRAANQVTFPAKFQLIAAMNPCPCGYLGHAIRQCRCSQDTIERYQGKISGPLLDRIDMTIEVPSISIEQLENLPVGESSAQIKEKVLMARQAQLQRQACLNAHLSVAQLADVALIEEAAKKNLQSILDKLQLSARGYHKVLRVARSIADWQGDQWVQVNHIQQAIAFRRLLVNK